MHRARAHSSLAITGGRVQKWSRDLDAKPEVRMDASTPSSSRSLVRTCRTIVRRGILSALFGVALLLPHAAWTDHDPLPDTITTPNLGYVVDFDNDNPYTPPAGAGDDTNFFPTTQAQSAADALDRSGASAAGNPNGYHNGYVGLGFLAPDFDGADLQTLIFDCGNHGGCDSGNAPADRINLPALTYIQSSDACIRLVMGHELFHHVQYAYIDFDNWSGWGDEPVEGTARMMQDKLYTDIDSNSGCITYRGEVNDYLGNPNRTMWDLSYTTALFWNYLTEQLGTNPTEPAIGTDFVRRFWQLAGDRADEPDFVGVLRQTVQEFDVFETLENVFHDFTIANAAKDLDLALIPDGLRYRYVDENDGVSGDYNQVMRTWTGQIPPDRGPVADSVVAWGARYYEATIDPKEACRSGVVGFRGEGDLAAYGLIAVSEPDRVQRIVKARTGNFRKSFLQRPDRPYTRLIASVAGLEEAADFTYTFACGGVQMTIVEPTAARQAYVGNFDAPERFLIRTIVTGPASLGTPTVEGLEAADFEVYVGSPSDPANQAPVVSAAHVQGEYWIVAQAPAKAANGVFDLTVRLPGVSSAFSAGSVNYAIQILDQVLVIDRSGSMLSPAGAPKLDAAKNAATLFVDAAGGDDQIGVVTFGGDNVEPNDDATLARILQPATDGQRNLCKAAIGGISTAPNVLTSIGDGLDKGGDEFPIRGSVLGEDWLVLMSDGMQNEAQFWNTIRPAIQAAGIKVNAIALGPLTDQALLQSIADDTGGIYYYVDVGSAASLQAAAGAGASAAAAVSPGTLPNRLSDAYSLATERIQRLDRLWEIAGTSGGPETFPIDVGEGGIEDARFAFNWSDPADKLQVNVRRPNGTLVADGVAGARIFSHPTHVVVQVPALTVGTWQVELAPLAGAPEYFGVLQGRLRNGTQMTLQFAQTHGDLRALAQGALFLRGLPMPIHSVITDSKGPILGANVEATIEHPDGSTILLPLFDDGSHGDGAADDGAYGNVYTRTTAYALGNLADGPDGDPNVIPQKGSYPVRVIAFGQDSGGQPFTRIRKGAFEVNEVRDSSPPVDIDQDGMPTRYELLHSCLDPTKNDAKGDPDFDELDTILEWEAGTDPCSPDTDRGGESDRSELGRGANPFDGRDDALPRPEHVAVIDSISDHQSPPPKLFPNQNLLRFPVHPSYEKLRVLRATSPNGPFAEVASFDPRPTRGLFYDIGLVNGVTYYYLFQAFDLNGSASAPSRMTSGTPKMDPYPSLGGIAINGGAPFTSSLNATLALVADPDTVQMRLANEPTFTGAPFVAFAPNVLWTLAPTPAGVATVYVQYRDAAANVSTTYHDDIQVLAAASVGNLIGVGLLQGQADHSGILAKLLEGPGEGLPDLTSGAGAFGLGPLLPGAYRLLLERSGYQSLILDGIVVPAGGTANVGANVLLPLDFDSDGVPDTTDNCPTVPNPLQEDGGGLGAGSPPNGRGDVCECGDVSGNGEVTSADAALMQRALLSPPTATMTRPELCDVGGNPGCSIADAVIMRRALLSPPTATIGTGCVPALP